MSVAVWVPETLATEELEVFASRKYWNGNCTELKKHILSDNALRRIYQRDLFETKI